MSEEGDWTNEGSGCPGKHILTVDAAIALLEEIRKTSPMGGRTVLRDPIGEPIVSITLHVTDDGTEAVVSDRLACCSA